MQANLFVIFPGWTPDTCAAMSIAELMRWHDKAIARHGPKES
ncbi:GpE family phage tail protein [Sphingomonas sp. PR090111-T3T-6A]|nr:GpE family phage tail protein [Sphingomonas sp. PR090111-T3T-6A]